MMEAKRLKKAANEAAKHIRLKRQAAAVAERLRVEHAEAAAREAAGLPGASLFALR